MFNLNEFEDSKLVLILDKFNKYLEKDKISKISKLINELENLIDLGEFNIKITYIFSILAENKIELISENLIQKLEDFLYSDNLKLKINSIIIIGFAILSDIKYYNKYIAQFIKFLKDESNDVRNNVYYFLTDISKKYPNVIDANKSFLLDCLLLEKNNENIISLLNLLYSCEDLNFTHLYKLREASKSLISLYYTDKALDLTNLLIILKKFFPSLIDLKLENYDQKELIKLLDGLFLMKKYNFTQISTEKGLTLKEFINQFKNLEFRKKEVYFYIKLKENLIYFYEIEKDKLDRFFNTNNKISYETILNTFSNIIESESELKVFIDTLVKLRFIDGFYSNLGNFYPIEYIESQILNDIQMKGIVKYKNYNYLPIEIISKILSKISVSSNQIFLEGKQDFIYYSLKKIQENVNIEAAKNNVIDLKVYRERLKDKDFIKLVKSLPKDFLTNFHKGTQWLTNIGLLKIKKEIENSKILGYYSISNLSEKLNIGKILLIDVLDQLVDSRSGIWGKNKEVFYFSRFIKEQVDEINLISDLTQKEEKIEFLASKLKIDKSHISTKINENLKLIGEEIKKQDQIRIGDYLEKTGLELDFFMQFIEDLGITYFKKGDILIFDINKIEAAKNDVKYILIDRSKSYDYISLGTFDIKSSIIESLIDELMQERKIKGIFHEIDNEILFYTERGIRNLMLENSLIFSFHDLLYDKELSQMEIDLLKEIFNELVSSRRLKGHFDEDTFTFFSEEVLFANDYNTNVNEFSKMVNSYIQKFDLELKRIKPILTKKNETIYPTEIKIIQESIDRINTKYVFWRDGLEIFIRNANKKLLQNQGISIQKFKNLKKEFIDKQEIKVFEEDIEVTDLMANFNNWIKLFNDIEIKYPNVIFYQKRFINNPNDKESKEKYNKLLDQLKMI